MRQVVEATDINMDYGLLKGIERDTLHVRSDRSVLRIFVE